MTESVESVNMSEMRKKYPLMCYDEEIRMMYFREVVKKLALLRIPFIRGELKVAYKLSDEETMIMGVRFGTDSFVPYMFVDDEGRSTQGHLWFTTDWLKREWYPLVEDEWYIYYLRGVYGIQSDDWIEIPVRGGVFMIPVLVIDDRLRVTYSERRDVRLVTDV